MIEIKINNQPAVFEENTQIKLTRENPLYSESGDYTLEVTFPLLGCPENQKIFGSVHRPEMSRKGLLKHSFDFALRANDTLIGGRARVISVTQEEIRLQLLAGKSAFNFDSTNDENGEEKYIDELELGSMVQRIDELANMWIEGHQQEYTDSYISTYNVKGKRNRIPALLFSKAFTEEDRSRYMFGGSDVTDCVFFPIYSEKDEAWSNRLDYRFWGYFVDMGENANPRYVWNRVKETYFFRFRNEISTQLPHSQGPGKYPYQSRLLGDAGDWATIDNSIAPQPYLCYVVESIFASLGYSLHPADNALRRGAFKNVFIANARNTEKLKDILPHWTVKQFFENLHKFLNVMILVEGKRVSIVSRNDFFANCAPIVLTDVTDEQSTSLSEDANINDTTAGNVGYDFPFPLTAKNHLGERYEQVEIRRFNSYEEIRADFNSLDVEVKRDCNILYIDMTSGERYYINHNEFDNDYNLQTIDLMGPLWRTHSGKIDNQLKFVPVRMTDYKYTEHRRMSLDTSTPGSTYYNPGEQPYTDLYIPYMVTDDTRESVKEKKLNLSENIYSTEDDKTKDGEDKRDFIELAYNVDADHRFVYSGGFLASEGDNNSRISVEVSYPVGIPYYKSRNGNWKDEGEHLFVLRNHTGQLVQELDALSLNIDTRCVFQVEFLDKYTDPMLPVLIRGRKYVCQKLEITIDEDGVQPLKRGYFYEVGE